jgi:hypothetical protein
MSDYTRSTIECSVRQLRPELRRAIDEYFQKHELGEAESETLLCCETVSEKKEPGWLASLLGDRAGPPIYTAALLTASYLIWARGELQSGITVTGADLRFIRVKPYASLFLRDAGLEISGIIGDSKGGMSGYIGMGPEPATQKFCDEVQQAIAKINPSSTRKWPSWMGGGS